MMRAKFCMLYTAIAFLAACETSNHSDLEVFINNAGNGLHGQVDPVPEVKRYDFFTYDAFEISNPFVPRKNEQVQPMSNGIKPDLNRRKEYLESYPLESLEMVGSLEQNDTIYGLVKTPEGSLLRVDIGNYLGQDFGKIQQISESEIQLRELVQDDVNEWTERVSTLMLNN